MKAKKSGILAVLAAIACAFTVAACETKPASASVTFDLAGGGQLTLNGTPVAETTVTVKDGDKISEVISGYAATRTGYTFTGWTDADGNAIGDQTASKDGGFTVKAAYTINDYTVVLKLNGGSYGGQTDDVDLTLEYGAAIAPETPAKRGHNFGGWYTDGDFSRALADDAAMGAAGIELYAKWTPQTYTIDYDLASAPTAPDGWDAALPKTHTFGTATALPDISDDLYPNHQFGGWQVDGAGSQSDIVTEIGAEQIDADVRLVCKWEGRVYEITYRLEGGAWPAAYTPKTQSTYPHGGAIYTQQPVRPGYEFNNFTMNGSKLSGNSIPRDTDIDGYSIELTANWTAAPQVLSLNLNGGTYGDTLYSLEVNTDAPVKAALTLTPAKYGYRFTGWYTDAACTQALSNDAVMPVGGMTVYAAWEATGLLKDVAYYDGDTKLGDHPYYSGTPLAPDYSLEDETMTYDGWYDAQGNFIGDTTYSDAADVPDAVYIRSKYIATMTFTEDKAEETVVGYIAKHPSDTAIVEFPALYRGKPVTQVGNAKTSGTFSTPTKVIIPASVKTLPDKAFRYYSKLTEVVFQSGSALETLGQYAFGNCAELAAITLPASVKTIGANAFASCSALATITFDGDSLLSAIGNSAFSSSGLTAFTIPAGVTTLGTSLFNNCDSLASVTFADISAESAITQIPNNAFQNCAALTAVTLPASVTAIGSSAFKAAGLTSFDFGAITSIGTNAFQQSKLTSVHLPGTAQLVGTYHFASCADLTSATLGQGITALPASIFSGCAKLTAVTLPDGLVTVGASAFENCAELNNFTLPNEVTTLGQAAFKGCVGLTGITIPASITAIPKDAFNGSGLTSVTLQEGLESIGLLAFANTKLTGVTIPSSVTSVGTVASSTPKSSAAGAFYGCQELTTVTFAGTALNTLGDGSFANCSKLGDMTVPVVSKMGGRVFINSFTAQAKLTVSFAADASISKIALIGALCGEMSVIGMKSAGVAGAVSTMYATIMKDTGTVKPTVAKNIPEFAGCVNLTAITFDAAMTNLDNLAFYKCAKLASVTLESESAVTVKEAANTFAQTEIADGATITLNVPQALVETYQATFAGVSYLQIAGLTAA